MATRHLLLAAMLAAASSAAQADATFEFAIHGSGNYAAGGWEGCSPDHPEQCVHPATWLGTLAVETTGSADGVYDVGGVVDNQWVPGGIVRVVMDSNVGSTDIDAQAPPGTQYFPGSYVYAVTIAGGRVTAIEWTSTNAYDPAEADGLLQIDGMGIHYLDATYHGVYADMSGTLTPVPEPGSAALALLGLAVAAAGVRRRGLSSPPGSSPAASARSGS